MNQKSKRLSVYFRVLPIAAIIAVTLRTVAALTSFDFVYGYFDSKTIITAANILTVAVCFFFFTYVFVAEKSKRLIAAFSTPATYIPTGAVCAALILFAGNTLKSLNNYGMPLYEAIKERNYIIIFEAAIGILALLATLYFVLAAINSERASTPRAVFGIITVLFLAAYASLLYFSTNLPANAPNKAVDQIALLFSAIFFLYETRISIGREKWHLYIGFGLIAAMLTAYSAIPSIIVYFVKNRTLSASIYESALTLTLFIFIISRLALAFSLKKDEENAFVAALCAVSDERNARIEEKSEARRLAYIELMNRMNRIEDGEEIIDVSDASEEYSDVEENDESGDITSEGFEETVFTEIVSDTEQSSDGANDLERQELTVSEATDENYTQADGSAE